MSHGLSTIFKPQNDFNKHLKIKQQLHPRNHQKLMFEEIPIKFHNEGFNCATSLSLSLLSLKTQVSFKNIAGCMLLECIAISAFSSKSLAKVFQNLLIFAYEFYHFKICNFIRVLLVYIEENADNLTNAESYGLASNYRQFKMLVRTEAS